jgi:putative membrane protein
MNRFLAAASLLALLLGPAPPAIAQTPPAGTKPAQPEAGAPKLNDADRNFLRDAALGGMAEVELGKLAESKAQSDRVKAFARRMVEDHGKANDRLAALAKDAGSAPPSELDSEHQAIRKRLEGLSGIAFDRAYIDAQVAEHQTAAQLFEWEIAAAHNPAVKNFAATTLPIIHDHLETALDLQMEMPLAMAPATGSSTGPGGPSGSGQSK